MTIDMTAVLADENGRPIFDTFSPECADGKPPALTLGHAISHALCAAFPDEQNLSGDQKMVRVFLARRIRDAADAELTSDETTVIKRLMGKMFTGTVLVQAIPTLDPASINSLPRIA